MNLIRTNVSISLLLSLFLIACYPGRKVLAYYPNGKVRVERHYKWSDSLNEIYIKYYDNGQVEEADYWHNRHAFWAPGKTESFYKNGAKLKFTWINYKDTVGHYNAADSTYAFIGLYKYVQKIWYKNGNIQSETYNENGNEVYISNNEKGDSLVKTSLKKIRPDNFDSLKVLSVQVLK